MPVSEKGASGVGIRVPESEFPLAKMGEAEIAPITELACDLGAGAAQHGGLTREEEGSEEDEREQGERGGQAGGIAHGQGRVRFWRGFDLFLSYCHTSCFDAS